MVSSEFTYWEYTVDDYELARIWSEAHGRPIVRKEWLPSTGFVIVENNMPMLFMWVYFEVSCPICFVDWLISKPGISAKQVRDGVFFAFEQPIARAMKMNGAEVAMMHCPIPLLRSMPKESGWAADDTPIFSIRHELIEERAAV